MKKAFAFLIITSFTLSLTGCISVLKGGKVNMGHNENVTIYADGTRLYRHKKGDYKYTFKTKISRPKQLEVVRKGHKTKNVILHRERFNFGAVLANIPAAAAIGIGAGLSDPLSGAIYGVGSYMMFAGTDLGRYPQTYARNPVYKPHPIPDTENMTKTMSYRRIDYDTAGNNGTYTFKNIKQLAAFDTAKARHRHTVNTLGAFGESKLRGRATSFLSRQGLFDTVSMKKANYADAAIYVNFKEYSVNVFDLGKYSGRRYSGYNLDMLAEVKVEMNGRLEPLTFEMAVRSDDFLLEIPKRYAIADVLDYISIRLLEDPEMRAFLEEEDNDAVQPILAGIMDGSSHATQDFDPTTDQKRMLSLVTRLGHAVAVPVGKGGMVMVNHRALDFVETPVLEYNGHEYEATVEATSLVHDFALLKIDTTFKHVYPIYRAEELGLGEELTVVGKDMAMEMTQHVPAVTSAWREEEQMPLLQISAEVNHLFHPAVFTESGELYGFVSFSLRRHNVSGISFVRPLVSEQNEVVEKE